MLLATLRAAAFRLVPVASSRVVPILLAVCRKCTLRALLPCTTRLVRPVRRALCIPSRCSRAVVLAKARGSSLLTRRCPTTSCLPFSAALVLLRLALSAQLLPRVRLVLTPLPVLVALRRAVVVPRVVLLAAALRLAVVVVLRAARVVPVPLRAT